MSDQNAIEAATLRLAQAVDALEAALDRRLEADRGAAALAEQLHALSADRARLAAELDAEITRSRRLETINREMAHRLDTVMDNIRAVLGTQER